MSNSSPIIYPESSNKLIKLSHQISSSNKPIHIKSPHHKLHSDTLITLKSSHHKPHSDTSTSIKSPHHKPHSNTSTSAKSTPAKSQPDKSPHVKSPHHKPTPDTPPSITPPPAGSVFDISKYGVYNNINKDSANGILNAFNDAAKYVTSTKNTAEVYVPSGKYYISSLNINGMNNMKWHFGQNAQLYAFDMGKWKWSGGMYDGWLTINNCTNFELYGEQGSLLDGAGKSWWNKADSRPTMNMISGCSNLIIRNIRVQNSPYYHFRLLKCQTMIIHDLVINSPLDSPNTDGINCRGGVSDLEIYNCDISNGDDAIAINSADSDSYNIHVHDCNVTGSHGLSLGSTINYQIYDILFENIQLKGPEYGCRIKPASTSSNNSKVKNITYRNINLSGVQKNPILVTCFYRSSSPDKATLFDTITFDTINCSDSGYGMSLYMDRSSQLLNPILLKNVSLNNIKDSNNIFENTVNAAYIKS